MIDSLKCFSPIDGSLYAERPFTKLSEAQTVIEQLKKGQKEWAKRPLSERASILGKAVENLGSMDKEIITELAWQMGRPVRCGGEFGGVKERADYMTSIAEECLRPAIIESSTNFVRKIVKEAQGLVLVVAPWNYPFMTAMNTIFPAMLAGNAVLLKHSSQTPLVGERIEKAFHAAGVPENAFRNLFPNHRTVEELIASKSFNYINFTGSVPAGMAMEKSAAGTFTGVGTELGGKDPAYVMEDANLQTAAETLVDGAMYNSGQCCCGIERIYVAEKIYDEFLEKVVGLANSYKLGNPLDEQTTLGPMARESFADEVRNQIDEAVKDGAVPLVSKENFPNDGGAYLMPQILTDVSHDMKIMKEESFGPVAGIMKVKNDAEAIRLMNDSFYGLTASLWTSDFERAERIGKELETGTVFMNRCDYVDPALCWTGQKDTGRGVTLSAFGFQSLVRLKSYHLKKAQ